MIKKVFTWGPIIVVVLMTMMIITGFSFKKEFMDQPDPITKDGSISAAWVLAALAGTVVALLTTIFLFAWRVIQMQGVTLNKATSMQENMQIRMKILEDVCLPSHLNEKGNAEKMSKILRQSTK